MKFKFEFDQKQLSVIYIITDDVLNFGKIFHQFAILIINLIKIVSLPRAKMAGSRQRNFGPP
jgi:hypothetical protein